MGEIDTCLQGAPQWVKGCTKFRLPLPPSSQPLCLVEVGQRGREMWCMNSFLESSDCTLQGTCSVTSHENTVYNICDYYYEM